MMLKSRRPHYVSLFVLYVKTCLVRYFNILLLLDKCLSLYVRFWVNDKRTTLSLHFYFSHSHYPFSVTHFLFLMFLSYVFYFHIIEELSRAVIKETVIITRSNIHISYYWLLYTNKQLKINNHSSTCIIWLTYA